MIPEEFREGRKRLLLRKIFDGLDELGSWMFNEMENQDEDSPMHIALNEMESLVDGVEIMVSELLGVDVWEMEGLVAEEKRARDQAQEALERERR